jgi:hypothetical protein
VRLVLDGGLRASLGVVERKRVSRVVTEWLVTAHAAAHGDAVTKRLARMVLGVHYFATNMQWAEVWDQYKAGLQRLLAALGAPLGLAFVREELHAKLGGLTPPPHALVAADQEASGGAPPRPAVRQSTHAISGAPHCLPGRSAALQAASERPRLLLGYRLEDYLLVGVGGLEHHQSCRRWPQSARRRQGCTWCHPRGRPSTLLPTSGGAGDSWRRRLMRKCRAARAIEPACHHKHRHSIDLVELHPPILWSALMHSVLLNSQGGTNPAIYDWQGPEVLYVR